jgi:DNA (cytosine-5)-methyltransferase 3A
MIKLLLGGSPCTHWSIAQKNNRETEPAGEGWELFKNYLMAREKYKPDYFLYENNKSMAAPIREQITRELGVQPVLINSALVSAQNRQRLYWTNIPGVEQPEDKGILLRDVLESGIAHKEKAYTLRANGYKQGHRDHIQHIITKAQLGTMGICEPIGVTSDGKAYALCATYYKGQLPEKTLKYHERTQVAEPATLEGVRSPVYKVRNGIITIKEKEYPINLPDGYYIIRKLTVTECKRLQTVPDDYIMPCSATQSYKMLGNGWTVDVIAHILSYIPNVAAERVEVFSMYDGMSCGHIALDKLGAEIIAYWATEIDKYAIQTTQANYPDTIQLGDAFQVRDEGWALPVLQSQSVKGTGI